jgi:hypothetical protein
MVPLSSPEKSSIDKSLIGKWCSAKEAGDDSDTISIYQFNEKELLIIIQENKEMNFYGAHVSIIKGQKFLNIHHLKKEARDSLEYSFLKYSTGEEKFSFQIIEDKLFKEKFMKSKNLRKFIEKNLDSEDLYGELEILIRV